MIATGAQLRRLIEQLDPHDRVAVDTEADSLHCYREKLCLLQISSPNGDDIVDPLADVDLAPLADALAEKEIVLHGADFDLRMLRRGLNLVPTRIFDTVIAARLVGIRQFSLAALVERFFNVKLPKGSQKANWARRPLPARMAQYAMNDTRYLLPLAEKLEAELQQHGRMEWFRQSCQRAIEQAAIKRTREPDEIWRIRGAGALRGQAAAVLRALWQWREQEAEAADRPVFHILRNEELLRAAQQFANGDRPEYTHLSPRRRRGFVDAAERALQLPPEEWPVAPKRSGTRPTLEMLRRSEQLRGRRDRVAHELKLEPTLVAPRATLDAIAAEESRAATLLLPWQRAALGI